MITVSLNLTIKTVIMKYLAIDTSGTHLTVLLKNGENLIINASENCGTKHSVSLMPAIEKVLTDAKVNLGELDFIACVTGAGSFTGIRIGVSTVKALCFSAKVKALAVTAFDTLAYNKPSGKVLAVIDAKHGNYYACGYNDGKIDLAPCFIDTEKLTSLAMEYTVVTADDLPVESEKVDRVQGFINATNALYKNANEDLSLIEPLYIRKSQAEEGR